MIALLVLTSVVADIAIDSDEACVAAGDVVAAIDATAALDPADDVRVLLTRDAPPAATSDEPAARASTTPWFVVVDAALARGAPLHREARLRDVECADVPALVALWLRDHQRSTAVPLPDALDPVVVDDVTLPATHGVAAPPPPPPRAPLPARDPVVQASPMVPGAGACDGPMACGGLTVDVGVGVTTRGAAIVGDVAWPVLPQVVSVGSAFVDADGGGSGGTAVGLGYLLHEHDVALRGTAALAVGSAPVADSRPASSKSACVVPASTSPSTERDLALRPWAGPQLSARARWGWAFVELGARYRVGVDAEPEVFGVVGLQLLGR